MKKRNVFIFLLILVGTILLNLLARNQASFADWYLINILPIWVNILGRITGVIPFSIGEMMIAAGCVLVLIGLILGALSLCVALFVRKKEFKWKWGKFCKVYYGSLAWIGLGAFVIITLNSLILFHSTNFTDKYFAQGMKGENEYTIDELALVRDFVVLKCNELSKQMERDENGQVIYHQDMGQTAIQCMQSLGEEYGELKGYYPPPKSLYFSDFFSQQYMQGYFFPFSMEANINNVMNIMNKPSTMCHELAHLKGIMQEDEANLIAFLACINSEDPFFQYSGYLSVLNYLDNDYYDSINKNKEVYLSRERITSQVRRDNAFLTEEAWAQVEQKAVIKTETVDTLSNQLLDVALVINGVEDGRLSYCRVVGHLMNYYAEKEIVVEPPLLAAE